MNLPIGSGRCPRSNAADRVLKHHSRVHPYRRGTWGPKQADTLIAKDGFWHNPRSSEA